MADIDLTEVAHKVLKELKAEGQAGRIDAERVFPFPHRFKLRRAGKGTWDVTGSTVADLVGARFIIPDLPDGPKRPEQYDRFGYKITQDGLDFLKDRHLETKRRQPRKKDGGAE